MTLRSDLAGTLFLSDPQEYEGGELVLHQGFTRLKLKPEANTLVVYPANLIHEVSVVTQGVSERASLYFQSLIASHEHRAVLWDLQCARKKLLNHDGDSELLTTLHRTVQELLRLWAHV
jgi:PKHD-type hydroxylase